MGILGAIIVIGEWSKPKPAEAPRKATPPPPVAKQSANAVPPSAEPSDVFEVDAVAKHLRGNRLGVAATDLMTKKNPKGEGHFVDVPKTRFRGVERPLLWFVLDGRAYPLNGPSKDTTPNLPWPREADQQTWANSGLNPYSASEAIEIVFGGR